MAQDHTAGELEQFLAERGEELSEAEAAALLRWPEGTVKSAAARGLQRLRGLAGSWQQDDSNNGNSGRDDPAPEHAAQLLGER